MERIIFKLVKRRWIVLISTPLLMSIFLVYLLFRYNIHTVSPGKLYRSGQLPPLILRRVIQSDHIRTVINLRGLNPEESWYRDEIAVTDMMGVAHYDLRLQSRERPSFLQMRAIIHLLEVAPKPILLHCASGNDRTGFAVALWLLLHNHSLSQANKAFFVPYFRKDHDKIGEQMMSMYVTWLQRKHYATNEIHLLEWVNQG